jgi:hypothetical protein
MAAQAMSDENCRSVRAVNRAIQSRDPVVDVGDVPVVLLDHVESRVSSRPDALPVPSIAAAPTWHHQKPLDHVAARIVKEFDDTDIGVVDPWSDRS